jgi:poly-gamma-glutamate capsule biosynthesis protein CapA/YwtB (metallophosphatase superfamily)
VKLALAGDAMLGRKVGEAVAQRPARDLVDDEVAAIAAEADLFVLNLECCISDRGAPWPSPDRETYFRAPPRAAELLAEIGVGCVNLANNHALDFGPDALLDTFDHLRAAGIRWVGAGADMTAARAPAVFEVDGLRLAVLGACDHAARDAATPVRPGVAHADVRSGTVAGWLTEAVAGAHTAADAVVLTPHWGPHMVTEPEPHIRTAARRLGQAGAALVAGHSAHLCHGVEAGAEAAVLYDMGDFLNDYATHIQLRNDLGLLFLVTLDATGPVGLEAVPLHLASHRTRLATGRDHAWMRRRFRKACRSLGTEVTERDGRLVVDWRR